MRVMVPYSITSSDIISNTATNTVTVYNGSTTYTTGNTIYKNNFVYEALKTSFSGKDPENYSGGTILNPDWVAAGFTAIADPYWLVVGMINPLKVFDSYLSTATTAITSWTVEFSKGSVDTIYFLRADAATITIEIRDVSNVLLSTVTFNPYADVDFPSDEYEWCWSPIPEPRSDFAVDLNYTTSSTDKIKVLTTGTNISMGKICAGYSKKMGNTQWGFDDGIVDYSKITTDDFGESFRRIGNYTNNIKASNDISPDEGDEIRNQLIKVRGIDCVWDFNENGTAYSSLIAYGLASEWRKIANKYGDSKLTITINGSI